ncbi:MAG TPA: hypothetical protein VFD49_17070 [Candidatus Dormibacteraeota bacterium]|nr:hypothetical protein [Candidatus Dormibacteraeota bacterium]
MTTLDDRERRGEAFLVSPARFADRFARRGSREQAAEYLWDVDAARDRLQAFVRETFGDPEGDRHPG